MESPLVSIIVPTYNSGGYLRESLDSIVAQTYTDREIIVMDDASTDETPEIIASYGESIRAYRQETNQGQFANVNQGIERSEGAYVAVYHADDIYDSSIVEQEVAFLERWRSAGAVFALDVFIDAEGREYGRLELPSELRSDEPLDHEAVLNAMLTHKNAFLVGPTAMIRASVLEQLGLFRPEYGIAADLEMWMRVSSAFSLGILDRHLHRYRHGHGNLSQTYYHLRTEQEGHFQILDELLSGDSGELASRVALRAHEAHRAEDCLMVAVNHYILGNLVGALSWQKRASLSDLLASRRVQRWRLAFLTGLLALVVRLPRIPLLARAFRNRWHGDVR